MTQIPSMEALRMAIDIKMGPIDTTGLPPDAAELTREFTGHTRQVGAHLVAMILLARKSKEKGYDESARFMLETALGLMGALRNAGHG